MVKVRRRRHFAVIRPQDQKPKVRTPKFLQKQKRVPTPLPGLLARPPIEREAKRLGSRFLAVVRFLFFITGQLVQARLQRLFGRKHAGVDPVRLRITLQRMGGVWVKAGQLIAMRRDLFSTEICDELGHLHDSADGFPGEVARQIIEQELGQPIDEIFSEFDERPLAAASIGQVHLGRLRKFDARVVVKVQRPYIVEQFAADLRILRKIVYLLDKMVPAARWYQMLWELEKALSEEVDYRREGTSLKSFRRSLKEHNVHVPRPFLMYTRERVLVMEYVQGVFMSDYIRMAESDPVKLQAWLDENDIDPVRLGHRLYCSMMRQAFEDNRFHCDLHPGNIMILRNSRFALIDFGSTGNFDVSLLRRYHRLFEAMTEKNYERVSELFLMLGPSMPHISLDEVKNELNHVLRDWDARTNIKNLPYHEKSLTSVFNEIGRIFARYNIPPTWEALRFNRALYTLDASLMYLIPRVNYSTLARRYWRGFQRRQVRTLVAGSRGSTLYGLKTMLSMPKQLSENLFFQGETLRRNAIMFQGRITNAAYAGQQIFGWMLRMGALAGAISILRLLHNYGHRVGYWEDNAHCWIHRIEQVTLPYGFTAEAAIFVVLGTFTLLRLLFRLRGRMGEAVPELLVSRRH
jgi:ubiquinone biosynthesis protein